MKKIIATLTLTVATVFAVNAQTTNNADGTTMNKNGVQNANGQNQPNQTIDERAQSRTDRMVKDFNLNEDQTYKVMEQNQRYYSDYETMNGEDMKDADRDAMRDRSMNAYDTEMKGILDDDQYTRYNSMKSDYSENAVQQPAERATTPNNKGVDTYERPKK